MPPLGGKKIIHGLLVRIISFLRTKNNFWEQNMLGKKKKSSLEKKKKNFK